MSKEPYRTGRASVRAASPTGPEIATEVRIVRAEAPTSLRLHRWRMWRWDVTALEAKGEHRQHLNRKFGHTFTWVGAARAASREVTRW